MGPNPHIPAISRTGMALSAQSSGRCHISPCISAMFKHSGPRAPLYQYHPGCQGFMLVQIIIFFLSSIGSGQPVPSWTVRPHTGSCPVGRGFSTGQTRNTNPRRIPQPRRPSPNRTKMRPGSFPPPMSPAVVIPYCVGNKAEKHAGHFTTSWPNGSAINLSFFVIILLSILAPVTGRGQN